MNLIYAWIAVQIDNGTLQVCGMAFLIAKMIYSDWSTERTRRRIAEEQLKATDAAAQRLSEQAAKDHGEMTSLTTRVGEKADAAFKEANDANKKIQQVHENVAAVIQEKP